MPLKYQCRARGIESEETSIQAEKVRGSCYGCGESLQLASPQAPGFVEQDRYLQKLKHKQLDQLLCRRCRQLSQGEMVPAIQDAWSLRAEKGKIQKPLISPERLKEELAGIQEKRALVVLLVDLLDASGSFVNKLRDMTGRNPVVLIGTKVDLLPKGAVQEDVDSWLRDMALARKLNVIHVCSVSSRTSAGIPQAAAFIRVNRQGRDVFIVGAANVGKSAFSRALMQEMGSMMSKQYDPMAASWGKRLPVESPQPGTTLRCIPLRAFHKGGSLMDTPGLHLVHRLPHMLKPEEAQTLQPRGRLRPYVAPSLATISAADLRTSNGRSGSYSWGSLVRIDVQSQARDVFLTFYGPPMLLVTVPDSEQETDSQDERPTFAEESVEAVGGLSLVKQVTLQANGLEKSLGDLAISGLQGWVAVSAKGRGRIDLSIWAPQGIEAYLRPALPCPNPAVDQESSLAF